MWAKSPLLAIVNPAISDGGYRVLGLLAVPGIGTGEAVVSVPEIATAMGWSRRKVCYSLAGLEKLKILTVSRSVGKANAYAINSEVFRELPVGTRTQRVMRGKTELTPCENCGKLCVPREEMCPACRKEQRLDQKIERKVRLVVGEM